MRFGERLPNPFAQDAVTTHWFHPDCAAMKRPDALLETLARGDHGIGAQELARLATLAEEGIEHRRLARLDGAERSPSSRAACRQCREPIAKEEWRIRLAFYEEGRFNPAGFIHLACAGEYLGTTNLVTRIERFSPDLSANELEEIGGIIASSM